MAQVLLNEAKVDSGFQQMSRPGMAKRMDTGKLIDPALLESFLEGYLNAALWHLSRAGPLNASLAVASVPRLEKCAMMKTVLD